MKQITPHFTRYLQNRSSYFLQAGEAVNPERNALSLGLIFFTAILVLRSWENFSQPGLYAEDSIHYFNFYYGNIRTLGDIFQHPNGYYNLFNNLAAYLTAKADVGLHPLIYQSVCICFCILTVTAFSLSGLITNRYLLFISPLLLGLSGLNHLYYYISLTFQMYVVVLMLLVIMLWRRRAPAAVQLLLFVFMGFLIWSGPYSVLVVPVALAFIFFFHDKTLQTVGLLLIAIAYTLSVTKSTIMLENILNPDILLLWGSTLVTEVFFMGFKDSINAEKLILVAVTFLTVFFALRGDRFYLKTAILFLIIIIASFAPLLLSKKYLLYQTIYPCHLVIAQFFWLVFVLVTADRLLARWPALQHPGGGALIVVFAIFILADNIEHQDKRKVPVLAAMPRFLEKVKEAENMGLAEEGRKMIISTNGTSIFKAAAIVGDRSKNATLVDRIHVQ
ncbi:MAG: hypothetical protein VR65_13055 [Desulfobulbaceae bacterium BRH_c16a]|nr:MAG: hypothetical protein VR65_13055 [Desulfobulbaceae bacterium BRH_c16a]